MVVVDTPVFINLLDLAFNTILMSIYFTIAYLFFEGLRYATTDGKLMLRAVSIFFFVAGARYLTLMTISIAYIQSGIPEYPEITPFVYRVITELALVMAAIYFLYATIKKNPPTGSDRVMEKPKGR